MGWSFTKSTSEKCTYNDRNSIKVPIILETELENLQDLIIKIEFVTPYKMLSYLFFSHGPM